MSAENPRLLYGPESSILITGASSGIGAAIAQHLADYGGKIALFARRRDRLEALAAQLADKGARPLVLVGDVADAESVQCAHDRLLEVQGPVRIAFLNAGVGDTAPLTRFDADQAKRVFEVNVFGVINWLHHLLPPMLEHKQGTLVGISSLAASRGAPTTGAYCSSKAALSTLLESVRVETQTRGIHVSTVEPGFVRSEMTAENHYPMPWLMDTPDAARLICNAVARRKRMIRFPWQMAVAARLVRTLPIWLYDRLALRMLPRTEFDQLQH